MPGLLRGVARTAVVAGTWTAVSNGVSRRQAGRWAAQAQAQAPGQVPADGQAGAAAQQAYARQLAMPPPTGRYQRPLFQPAPRPAPQPAPPPTRPPAPYQAPPAAGPPAAGMDAKLRWLRQLGELRAQGVLSDAEVEAQKRAILER
ncbi:MAG TPA: SHOCT domain-containing protein [Chloroflexota bacterium]|nr:SHOCT domain-containing protein [Chloroflexota bacterium]